MKRVVLIGATAIATVAASAVLLGGWFLLAAGASPETSLDCEPTAPLDEHTVPPELIPIFNAASAQYQLGGSGPAILAGLTKVESDFGRNRSTSSAGAVGWTQFLPSTWASFGVDANRDGRADPDNAVDAIFSSANYLKHLGAPANWHDAIFGYNHAEWYVTKVLDEAKRLGSSLTSATVSTPTCAGTVMPQLGAVVEQTGAGTIVPIPGQPGETIDSRILPDLLSLQRRFHFQVTDGYAPTGHEPTGEHPLGLAVDLVPGPGGTWDDIDALARLAEPTQNQPRPPWRWVGYDGDSGHGRGNHLHLSWDHAPAPSRRPPAAWVKVFTAR